MNATTEDENDLTGAGLGPRLLDAPCFHGASSDPRLALCDSAGPNAGDLVAAARLALDDAGRRVALRLGDDRRDPAVARALAARLTREGVRYAIGHLGSATALPAAGAYAKADAMFLAPGTSADGLCRDADGATTLQFFGTDEGQVRALADGLMPICGRVLIVAQPRADAARLGAALLARLSGTHRRVELRSCEPTAQSLGRAPREADRIVVLGSLAFAEAVCDVPGVRASGAELLLSSDSFAPALLAGALPPARCRIAFLDGAGDRMIDQSASVLRLRAAALLGRAPGPFFATSYLAVRALAAAWDRVGAECPERVRRAMLQDSWATPFGQVRLSHGGVLQGCRWALHPAAALQETAGVRGEAA